MPLYLIQTRPKNIWIQRGQKQFSVKRGIRDDDPSHLQAIREALVNMLMHSDYFSPVFPRIRVFTNRIEFFNPGALPKKIEYILKEDFSLPRNPIIAKIFRFVKLAEDMGTGFHKMINAWYEFYQIKPEITGAKFFPVPKILKEYRNGKYEREDD